MNQTFFFKTTLGLALLVFGTGCLQTRSSAREVEQRQVYQQQATTLQKENVDVNTRFQEVNEQLRELRGRVEVVENRMTSGGSEIEKAKQSLSEQNQIMDRRVGLLQESLTKMEAQNQAMTAEIFALKAEIAALRAGQSAAAAAATPAPSQDSFAMAKEHFDKKEWKRAILSFQKYRDSNPKGAKVAEATYLMGVCFQELNMKDEAKSFYDEVIAKFPKSGEARKARTRLASLK